MDITKLVAVYNNLLLAWTQIQRIRTILKKKHKLSRRWWVKPHLSVEMRHNFGAHQNLFKYFKASDHEELFKFTRMSVEQFDMLHNLLKPKLEKRSHRTPLATELRLALTLSYLAHGDSAATTAWHFRVGKSTMYSIIPEVCKAIWDVLQPLYLRCPNEENEWLQIANDFNSLWNFPNCIGAIDGKHIRIKAPPRSGSAFYNYKGSFSIVLMAICDAHYRFTWLDIGDYGSLNDAGIWSNTEMSTALENNTVSLPPELYLPHTNIAVPFALVGDEGFPLKKYLMRPYARRNLVDNQQRIFNYRLSRVRRIIENAFGILVARWQIFQGSICFKLETVEAIVQATCCLHNFIISTNYLNNRYIQEDFIDREGPNGELIEGVWRSSIQHSAINRVGRVGANIGSVAAMRQRDILAQYFVSDDGSIPWQWEMI
ncbi:putative nuclease HARBI1 isoform X1 [Temnothorax nylanderi]|uniref:putative nuclease HARBI1 isoform X1 n=1 Tax=Temnothorax nylanderi TaxID=102681 RepID=UPI003A878363